jgi:hypothetical protein
MSIDHPRAGLVSQACPCCIGGRVDAYVGDYAGDRACGYCGGTGWTFSKAPPRDPVQELAQKIIAAAEARMDARGIPAANDDDIDTKEPRP